MSSYLVFMNQGQVFETVFVRPAILELYEEVCILFGVISNFFKVGPKCSAVPDACLRHSWERKTAVNARGYRGKTAVNARGYRGKTAVNARGYSGKVRN